jgi:hypothetical protein
MSIFKRFRVLREKAAKSPHNSNHNSGDFYRTSRCSYGKKYDLTHDIHLCKFKSVSYLLKNA